MIGRRPEGPEELFQISPEGVEFENPCAVIAFGYFLYYFTKIHHKLRVTSAMAAVVTDRLWEMADLVAVAEHSRPQPNSV